MSNELPTTMKFSDFKVGQKLVVISEVDLSIDAHGPIGMAPILIPKGETATVVDASDSCGEYVTLSFDRILAIPMEFGGPNAWLDCYDPEIATGLTWNDVKPAKE